MHGASRSPSQCARVLNVLQDGREHAMREIHERAGFMRLNSRIAELRSRGHNIECVRRGNEWFYRLVPLGASTAQETTSDEDPKVFSSVGNLTATVDAPNGCATPGVAVRQLTLGELVLETVA